MRKLRRADELSAAGKTGEEIAAELDVSPATLYNWRRVYGGMDTDAAKELKELREQNTGSKRMLTEAEVAKDALLCQISSRRGCFAAMSLLAVMGPSLPRPRRRTYQNWPATDPVVTSLESRSKMSRSTGISTS